MHKFRKHRGQEPPRKLCEVCDLTCLTTGGLRFHKNAEPSRMEGTQEFKCYLCDYTASKITASVNTESESMVLFFYNIISKTLFYCEMCKFSCTKENPIPSSICTDNIMVFP